METETDLGYDNIEDLEPAPQDTGLGVLYAAGEREAREKAPRKKYVAGPAAPKPVGISVVKANLAAAEQELADAQQLYNEAENLEVRAQLSVAMTELETEIAGLAQEVRVFKLKDSDPTTELQLAAEAARDAAQAYRKAHPETYEVDATYKRLRDAQDQAYLDLEQTSQDVAVRDDRKEAAAYIEGASRLAGDRAVRAELQRLGAHMDELGKQGRYAEAGQVQKEIEQLAHTVPDKLPLWKAAYAAARSEYLIAAQGAVQ